MTSYGNIGIYIPDSELIDDYMGRCDAFMDANLIPGERRTNLLLAIIGPSGYKLLKNLCQPDNPNTKTYSELKCLLVNYNVPSPPPMVMADRHKFWTARQGEDESVSAFVVRLQQLASTCGFGTFLEEAMRDRLVSGLHKKMARTKAYFFDVQNLSFMEAKIKCIADELASFEENYTENLSSSSNANRVEREVILTKPSRWLENGKEVEAALPFDGASEEQQLDWWPNESKANSTLLERKKPEGKNTTSISDEVAEETSFEKRKIKKRVFEDYVDDFCSGDEIPNSKQYKSKKLPNIPEKLMSSPRKKLALTSQSQSTRASIPGAQMLKENSSRIGSDTSKAQSRDQYKSSEMSGSRHGSTEKSGFSHRSADRATDRCRSEENPGSRRRYIERSSSRRESTERSRFKCRSQERPASTFVRSPSLSPLRLKFCQSPSPSEFQKQVLYLLLDIRSEVRQYRKITEPGKQESPIQQCTSLEEFQRQEKLLANDDRRSLLINKLCKIGGLNPRDVVYRMLSRLLTNKVMELFNYAGNNRKGSTQSKLGLGYTNTYAAVKAAVLKVYPNETENNIKQYTMKYLQNASGRQGNRLT